MRGDISWMTIFLVFCSFSRIQILDAGNKTTVKTQKVDKTKWVSNADTINDVGPLRETVRGGGKCFASVKFIKCDALAKLSRLNDNKFKVAYESTNCDYKNLIFNWKVITNRDPPKTVLNFPNYARKATFLLKAYSLDTGTYKLVVEVFQEPSNSKAYTTTVCPFEIKPEVPIAVIKGGTERYVKANTEVIVDGSDSRNLDYKDGGNKNLKYKWECDSGSDTEPCKGTTVMHDKFIFPKHMIIGSKLYFITMTVTSTDSNLEAKSEQTLSVLEKAVDIEIKCLKNCPPKVRRVDHTKLISFAVECVNYCENVEFDMFKWNINTENENDVINYQKDTQYGHKGHLFNIKPGVLQPGTKYTVQVSLTEGQKEAYASTNFITRVPIKIESCKIQPPKGVALTTKFIVECSHSVGDFSFTLYSVSSDGKETQIAEDSSLNTIQFVLPVGAKVIVKMTDEFDFTDQYEIKDVEVVPAIDSNADEKSLAAALNNTQNVIDDLLHQGTGDDAIQNINGLAEELKKINKSLEPSRTDDLKKIFVENSLNGLEKINVDSLSRVDQVSSTIDNILSIPLNGTDLRIAEKASEICKKVSEKQLEFANSSSFPTTLSEQLGKTSQRLMTCAESNLAPNSKILESSFSPKYTTAYPLVVTSSVVEDYPDYLDEEVLERVEKLKKAGQNFMDICHMNAKAMAISLAPGEETIQRSAQKCTMTSTKKYGRDLSNSIITSQNVTVIPSQDFRNVSDVVEIYLCAISYDPFWWNKANVQITSFDVMYLSFEINDVTIVSFTQPVKISFDLDSEKVSGLSVIQGQTPDVTPDSHTTTTEELTSIINENGIVIYRVDVYAQEDFIVEFVDLKKNESLRVAITHFTRPTLNHFQNNMTVSNSTPRIFQKNHRTYDSWYYIGILPSNQNSELKQQHFNMLVYTPACYRWNMSSESWEVACKVTEETNRQRMHCLCNKLSTLAGIVKNNTVHRDQVIRLKFTMTWKTNSIITITCLVVVLLYCILLTVVLMRSKLEKRNVYFLSDVSMQDRYLYLVMVKTGNKFFAGTTSNIMIRLTGTKHSSKVLSLDKYKEMLKRAKEDWFALATRQHLGDITKIELWYDHIGMRPSWSIKVQDMQSHETWHFEINKWFNVSTTANTFMEVHTRPQAKTQEKTSLLAKLKMKFQKPNSWRIFTFYKLEFISPFVKVNLMLSAVLTLFEVSLLCYELPSFDINTGFASFNDFGLYPHVILIGLGVPCIIFVYHCLLLYFFRTSETVVPLKTHSKEITFSNTICRTILWCVVTLNITVSLAFLLVFGCGIANITALHWLTSVLIGLLFYVLVLERIILLVAKPVAEKIVSIYHLITDMIASVENQRSYIYKTYGPKSLRPYFQHLYSKLDKFQVKEKYVKYIARQRMIEHLEDLVMFTIYLVLLYAVVLADRDDYYIFSYNEILGLISGEIADTPPFEDILSIESFDEYIEDSLIYSTQASLWYGKYVFSDPGMTIDNSNKYMGVIRLRQHRSVATSCDLIKETSFIAKPCTLEYWYSQEDRSFYPGWNLTDPLNNQKNNRSDNHTVSHEHRLASIWKYTRSGNEAPILGDFGFYPRGGYILPLGRTMRNSLVNYNYSKTKNWLDNRTRSVFVEFLAYCANANLFNSVRLLVEFSTTGYIRTECWVDTAKLFLTKDEMTFMTLMILICFIAMVTILFLRNCALAVKQKTSFFKQGWKLLDIIIILGSAGCVILFIVRTKSIESFMEHMERAKNNEFLDYFQVMNIDLTLSLFSAFLVFIATLRLWRLMRFKPSFRMMEKTIVYAAGTILTLSLYSVIFLISCVILSCCLLGPHSSEFRSLFTALPEMFLVSLGMSSFEVDTLDEVDSNLGYIFYSVYLLGSLFFNTLFETVLMYYYSEAQVDCSNERTYTVENYIVGEYEYYKKILEIKKKKIRSRAGEDRDMSLVYPKADEHRYAGAITTLSDKIQAMYYITLFMLTHKSEQKSYKEYLIKQILFHTRRSKEAQDNELFFKIYNDYKISIIPDSRMLLMETVTEILVTPAELGERLEKKSRYARNMRKFDKIQASLEVQLQVLDSLKFEIARMPFRAFLGGITKIYNQPQ